MTTYSGMEKVHYPNSFAPAQFPSLEIKKAPKKAFRRNPWGHRSYADLIAQAILSSPEQKMTLSQIYEWMTKNIPFFEKQVNISSSAGWKNSIRHNLSLHNKFHRIQNDDTGKSSWWTVNPEVGTVRSPRKKGSGRRKRNTGMENVTFFKNRTICKLPNVSIWTPSSTVSSTQKEMSELSLTELNQGTTGSPAQKYRDSKSQTSFRSYVLERSENKTTPDYFMSPHHLSGSFLTIDEEKDNSNVSLDIETDVGILSVLAQEKDDKSSVTENESDEDEIDLLLKENEIDLLLKEDEIDMQHLNMILQEIRNFQDECENSSNQSQDSVSNVPNNVELSRFPDFNSLNQQPSVESNSNLQSYSIASSFISEISPQTSTALNFNLSENSDMQALSNIQKTLDSAEPKYCNQMGTKNFCMTDSNKKLKEKIIRKYNLANNSNGHIYHSKDWKNPCENLYNSEESCNVPSFQNTFYANYQLSNAVYTTSMNLTNHNETHTNRFTNNTTYTRTVSQNMSQMYEHSFVPTGYLISLQIPDHAFNMPEPESPLSAMGDNDKIYSPSLPEFNFFSQNIIPASELSFVHDNNHAEHFDVLQNNLLDEVSTSSTFKSVSSKMEELTNTDPTIQGNLLIDDNSNDTKPESDISMVDDDEFMAQILDEESIVEGKNMNVDDDSNLFWNNDLYSELLSNPFLPALTTQEKNALINHPQTADFPSQISHDTDHPSQESCLEDAIEELLHMNSDYIKDNSIDNAVLEIAQELLEEELPLSVERESENIHLNEDLDVYMWNEVFGVDSMSVQKSRQFYSEK